MFNRASALLAATASSLATSVSGALAGLELLRPRQPHHYGKTRYVGGYKGHRSRYNPHHGDQETARRIMQADRNDVNQRERADSSFPAQVESATHVSRRGRIINQKEAR